ncbi:MAG: hypothetical protein ACO39Y_09775, partial [Ilumatobacteraceae bacterium]
QPGRVSNTIDSGGSVVVVEVDDVVDVVVLVVGADVVGREVEGGEADSDEHATTEPISTTIDNFRRRFITPPTLGKPCRDNQPFGGGGSSSPAK